MTNTAITVCLLAIAVPVTFFLATYGVGLWCRWRQTATLRRKVKGKLVLTYDDGPGNELTPRLVQLLDKHGAKATFFLTGFRAEKRAILCDQLRSAGHELASHGYAHINAWQRLWSAIRDIEAGYRAVAHWVKPDGMFRPPRGRLTLWTWLALRYRSRRPIWWTIDSHDSSRQWPSAETIVNQVLDHHGAVVLMHDCDRHHNREAGEYVLELTEQLLVAAKSSNLVVCTVSELLAA